TPGAGNNTISGGGGNDTYFFTGNPSGSDNLNDDPATSAVTLNFHGFTGGGIALDLSQSNPQPVGGNLTLTLTNPLAYANAVGSRYNDTITGNSGNNILIGGGGSDSIVAGNGGNDLLQGDVTQVVYLDFITAAGLPGAHDYTA